MKQLKIDPNLLRVFVSGGNDRAEIDKHVLSLYLSTIRYKENPNGNQGYSRLNLVSSIPPLYTCSSMIMAEQSITELVDGRLKAGHSPCKQMGDSTMEVGELLLDGTSKALLSLEKDMLFSFDNFPFTTFEDLFRDVFHTPIALF